MKVEILLAVHGPADADLHEARSVDELLFDCAAKWRAVKVLPAEILIPRVDVRVDLHQTERAVPLRERAENRERDRMVAADADRPRPRAGDGTDAGLHDI